jgi:hypothetical protein
MKAKMTSNFTTHCIIIGIRLYIISNISQPKFAGSNPAEAVGFFRAKKSSAHLPSEGK